MIPKFRITASCAIGDTMNTIPPSLRLGLDPVGTLRDMDEVQPVIFHRGTASWWMRSLIYQCSPPSVITTSTFRQSRSSRS